MNWEYLDGVKEVRELQQLARLADPHADSVPSVLSKRFSLERLNKWRRGNFACKTISRLDQGCTNGKCPKRGVVNSEVSRAVSDLRPMICDACGNLLVPQELSEALRAGAHV